MTLIVIIFVIEIDIWLKKWEVCFDSRPSNEAKIMPYDEESDHSNKAVRKTPEIESGHKVSEEVK